MDDERLISLVRDFEYIYNKQSPGFKCTEKKRDTWISISNELGYPVETCIKRWTSLRDQYTRECREKLAFSGYGECSAKRWHLYDAMDFLQPHIKFRSTNSSKNALETIILPATETAYDEPTEFEVPILPEFSPKFVNLQDASPIDIVKSFGYAKNSGNKKRKISDVDAAFCEAVNCFKELCEKEKSKKSPAVEGFGQMIMAILNDMSVAKQNKTIKLVTDLVMAIKEQPE